MAQFFLKLKLVLWKNFIIRKRHWILTTFEILMSVLIFLLLGYSRTLIPELNKQYINTTQYNEIRVLSNKNIDLFYTPNTSVINEFMNKVKGKIQSREFRGFANEHDMLEHMSTLKDHEKFHLVAVVFDNFQEAKPPVKLKYRIRTNMNSDFSSLFPLTMEPFFSYDKNLYFDKSFIDVQHAVDMAFIESNKKISLPSIQFTFEEMPYPPHEVFSDLNKLFLTVLPFCTILAFILLFPSVLKRVIEEKCTGIKELMKMMGLKVWMIWLGWFLHSMVTNIPAITFIVIMLKVGVSLDATPIIEYGSSSVLWVFLFLYCASGICFSFGISTFFRKPTLGMCVGMMAWMFTFFVMNPLVENDDPTAFRVLRHLVMVLPNACLVYGFKTISEYEKTEIGINWRNLWTKPNPYMPHPSMGAVFFMLIVDSLLFLLIMWYVDNVFPGEYGIARPWYFPFTKSYWSTNQVEDDRTHENQLDSRDEVEAVTSDLRVGVQVRNLHKKFGNKLAVNGLSFDVYSNQITVLLGHNGAGKSTTMNIITGMLGPTSGSVVVDGYNIQTNIDKVRESLGLCPQHNLQFPDLTVLEHLMFFAMLKGRSKSEAKEESHDFLQRLNIASKANKMASQLSGGMRRKLSLGMALVGQTRVLMLDEPTSGMDPEARREIWDFLLSMRGSRTILITTHYMEEADILGDRIAIMHHGQLMCYGTSLFLKKHYGTGYTLSILITPAWDINTLTEAIQTYIPSSTVKSISAGCVTFVLPTNDTEALSRLFSALEQNKAHLGVSSFGVSITTMEDVFLRVGEIADEVDKGNSKQLDSDSSKHLLADNYSEEPEKNLITSDFSLLLQQFKGLFMKRCQYSVHKWLIFLLQICIPIGIVLFIMIMMKMEGGSHEPDAKRELVLNPYIGAESFYSVAPQTSELGKVYATVVRSEKAAATLVDDVSDAILTVGDENLERYHRTLITAANLNYSTEEDAMVLNAMYGNFALHGPGISLNLLTNALLKYATSDAGSSISVTNNPLPTVMKVSQAEINISAVLMWLFQFPVAFTIMFGFFLIFPQEERLTGVKHLQLMTGVPRVLYWFTNYLFDLLVFIFIGIIIIIILVIFDSNGPFGNAKALNALCSLMFLYGFASLPFSYLFTYRPTASSSMTILIWIQILLGTIATVVVIVLENLDEDYYTARDIASYIFLFVPNFAFSHGIYRFASHASEIYVWDSMDATRKNAKCTFGGNPCCQPNSTACADFYEYFTGNYSIERNVVFLAIQIILYSILLLFIDSGIPSHWIDKVLDKKAYVETVLDEDVAEEKQRINSQINESQMMSTSKRMPETVDVLQVSNLRKWFRSFYAVRGLNFGVKSSECFGLLGINGAGKTTTFKMLTGELFPSTGYANILGFSLSDHKLLYLRKIGYCPQFDALNLTLTCRQMLMLFAHLRGIPPNRVNNHVNKWIHKFGIKQYEHIKCGRLSGGNKRKLSTAIALIGDPPLVMLDEPTSGVDPVARRNLWDILTVLRKSGQSIVLTSHSMDECEALCDRLAIMVDGQMKCIGNIQYLKSKFGQGFTVMAKLRAVASSGDTPDSTSLVFDLKKKIENQFESTLKDEHTGMLLYHVTNPNVTLSELFQFMESLKKNHGVLEDYAVSDTSLEQVFLSFAKEKIRDDDTGTVRTEATIV